MLRELGLFMWQRRRYEGTIPMFTDTREEEWRRGSQTLGSSAQWQGSGYAEMQEIPLKWNKWCFHCDEPRSRLLQRLWSFHTLSISKPDYWSPSLLWVTHLSAVGWTMWSPEVTANLSAPMKKNTAVWNGKDTKQAKFCNLLKYFFPAMALSV